MCGKTRMDKIRNEDIRSLVGIAPIEDKMRENHLQWFDHIKRKAMNALVRRMKKIDIEQSKKLKETKNDLGENGKKLYEITRIEKKND